MTKSHFYHLGKAVSALAKLKFDIAQLRHIAFENLAETDRVSLVIPVLQAAYKNLLKVTEQKSEFELLDLSDSQLRDFRGTINHASFLADERITKEKFSYPEALKSLQQAYLEINRNDFAVVDILLDTKIIREMSTILLTSTIWFDSTNGKVFAAHPDDGLGSFSIFSDFCRVTS